MTTRVALVVALAVTLVVVTNDAERAVADLSNALGTTASVRIGGRLVEEDRDDDPARSTPFDAIGQSELPGEIVSIRLVDHGSGVTTAATSTATDDEGFFDTTLDLLHAGLAPARYEVHVVHDGAIVGRSWALLLPPDYRGVALRSDVDLTYLDTDFSNRSAMVDLILQDASQRRTLPAMDVVYRVLRRAGDGDERLPRPLTFLSGSPGFFRRVIHARMALDGVEQDGVELKPFGDIVARNAAELTPLEIVPELEEQVGYKLSSLLELRLELPPATNEVLLGDDSEADVVVYALYHRLTARAFDVDALVRELERIGVAPAWREQIRARANPVLSQIGGHAPVRAIYINRTSRPNPLVQVRDWSDGGLVRHHDGAWPLVLDLHEEGLVDASGVAEVHARLVALGRTASQLAASAQAAVADGFLASSTAGAFSR